MSARLVDQVGQVGAAEAGCRAGQDLEVDVSGQGDLADVDAEDVLAALDVGHVDDDVPVEPAGPEEGAVEDVGPVGRGDEDDALVRVEAVHLDEKLVERLLALVVPAAEAGAALAADRVDLVDEDDAGRVLLALVEEVADARGADADEHLDEIGAADGEEGHVGLAGHGPGQQGLACPRRADEQHALGDAAAEPLELARLLEELDDLAELGFGLLDAGDVLEGQLLLLAGEELGPALAEGHGLVAAGLHLAHHEDPEEDHQEYREPADEDREEGTAGAVLDDDVDLVLAEDLDQVGVSRGQDGLEGLAVREPAADLVLLDRDLFDLALLDLGHELRESDVLLGQGRGLEEAPEGDDDDPGGDPEKEALHRSILSLRHNSPSFLKGYFITIRGI